MNVVINGGGIGGLTLAAALRDQPAQVTVLEQAHGLRAAGAGIVIAPNARHALATIGLDLASIGRPFDTFAICDRRGRTLGTAAPIPGPQPGVTVHRQALLEALASLVPAHTMHFDEGVERWDATTRTATTTTGRALLADLLVGADGIGSVVRRLGFEPDEPVRSGYRCWRAVVPTADDAPDTPIEYWGHGQRAGLVPLPDQELYVYACLNHGAARVADPGLEPAFAGFPPAVRGAIARAERWHAADIAEHDRHHWVADRIVCLGDASHALTPNLGQGAAMAIEDAVTLARALGGADLDAALAECATQRAPRVAWVAQQSRQVGAVGQWSHPWACMLRDQALRLAPTSATARLGRRLGAWAP